MTAVQLAPHSPCEGAYEPALVDQAFEAPVLVDQAFEAPLLVDETWAQAMDDGCDPFEQEPGWDRAVLADIDAELAAMAKTCAAQSSPPSALGQVEHGLAGLGLPAGVAEHLLAVLTCASAHSRARNATAGSTDTDIVTAEQAPPVVVDRRCG